MWLDLPVALPFLSTKNTLLSYDPYMVTAWPLPDAAHDRRQRLRRLQAGRATSGKENAK